METGEQRDLAAEVDAPEMSLALDRAREDNRRHANSAPPTPFIAWWFVSCVLVEEDPPPVYDASHLSPSLRRIFNAMDAARRAGG